MAPSEQYDRQVEELSSQYATAASLILAAVASLGAGATAASLQAARTTAQRTLEALLAVSVAWINLHIPRIYRSGVEEAIRVIEGPSQDEIREQADEAMKSLEHRTAMETLAETLRDDLQGAIEGMGRDANRALGEIRRRNIQTALAKGSPLAGVEDFAAEMQQRGIRFTDRGGRRWQPETYAETVLRTHVASILNAGHLNKAIEMGSRAVRVFDGGPGDVDEPCRRANGQTWGLAFAAANMLEHPRCRRSFAALPKGYSGEVDRGAA